MKRSSFLLALFCSMSLYGDQFSFQLYNDYFAGTDKHFTNGFALSWLDSERSKDDANISGGYSDMMLGLINKIPFTDTAEYKSYTAGASISQIMITPKDTTLTTPQYDDIPYAGYMALSLFLFKWDENSVKEYRVDMGVVGKESGAGNLQKSFHRLIKNKIPQGWDTQLRTRYIVNTLFRYGKKNWQKHTAGGLDMDIFSHCGFQAGNFVTDAFAGSMFRFGKNYTQNFNVHYPYLKEEASLLHLNKKQKGFGWALSAGINIEALAYSYILDGAKSEGYYTDKNYVNGSLYLGGDLYYDAHKLTYFYQMQSSYITSQKTPDIYGGLMYTYRF
ncbi:lipid A deacylase LpxR family protein [Sulfurimonas sp. HSL-1716]|uniref:lipid A deacylase LpxR family protein n=1 Tax=Hydrocurvibacter sulfurireducens TaxID=3131937 RepID=UPI0031F91F3B